MEPAQAVGFGGRSLGIRLAGCSISQPGPLWLVWALVLSFKKWNNTKELKTETQTDTYMLMLIAALSQYLKGRNNPSVHHQMNKQILVYTYNGISFCLRGMTFWYMLKYEWTLKNYACQTQKHIYYMTPLNMKYLDSANS